MFLSVRVSINLISVPTPSIKYVISFLVVLAVITPFAPAVDVMVAVVGKSPSFKFDSISSIDVISPLPPTAVTLPTVTPETTIASFTTYPMPGVEIINSSTV